MPGTLDAIWVKRSRRGRMDAVAEVELDVSGGIQGNADRGRRQVTILDRDEWERRLAGLGARLDPVARRANLLVRGVDLADSRGRVLQVGACRIRIAGETKPCRQMDEALPGLREALYARWGGGAWGAVVTGGVVALGDRVAWMDEPVEGSDAEERFGS